MTSAFETRPAIGERTCVNARLSSAASADARAARASASSCFAFAARSSKSRCAIALSASSRRDRSSSVRASSTFAVALAAAASARAASARYGRGSITTSTSPFFTSLPGVKRIASIVPDTRGRISARSTASMRPENSCVSTTCRSIAAATPTGGAGGGPAGGCAFVSPQPDNANGSSRAAASSAAGRGAVRNGAG